LKLFSFSANLFFSFSRTETLSLVIYSWTNKWKFILTSLINTFFHTNSLFKWSFDLIQIFNRLFKFNNLLHLSSKLFSQFLFVLNCLTYSIKFISCLLDSLSPIGLFISNQLIFNISMCLWHLLVNFRIQITEKIRCFSDQLPKCSNFILLFSHFCLITNSF
jgi:hypothetical protein